MCNMGFPAQWPVCSASTAASLGECSQIYTSPDPSGTRFDHFCPLLIRLALGFFNQQSHLGREQMRTVERHAMLLRADTHQRAILSILDWVVGIRYLARDPWNAGLPFHPSFFSKPCLPVRCELLFATYAVLCLGM